MTDSGIRAALAGSPAHAGMDPAGSRSVSGRRRLPRTRGDGPGKSTLVAWLGIGSPAHAGMDPCGSG